jgi:hypothetical protein
MLVYFSQRSKAKDLGMCLSLLYPENRNMRTIDFSYLFTKLYGVTA